MNFIDDENSLKNILNECFPHAKKIEILKNSADEETQNFTSDIRFITVQYEHKHCPRIKHLALKIPHTSLLYSFYESLNFYNKEVYLYDKFLPHINRVLNKKIVPKHYFSTDTKIIVMENVAQKGFKSAKRNKFFNLEDSKTLLHTLALFHAASYKIHKHYPHLQDDPSFGIYRIAEIREALVDTYQPILHELLEKNNSFHLIRKLKNIMTFLREDDRVNSIVNRNNFDFFVLNHGDYWDQNILLKRDQKNRIQETRIVDFQSCRWSTPVLDFFNFLITSIHVDVVDQYFDTLVQSYVNSLNTALMELHCSYTYERSNLMDDLKRVKVFLFDHLINLCALLCIPDTSVAEKCFASTGKMISSTEECLKSKLVETTISKWLKHYEKWGVFDVLEKHRNIFEN